MVRTTKPAKTADAAPVVEPVSAPVVADKTTKVKKTKKETAPSPVVETAPADDAADSSEVDVAPLAEKSIEFLAKLQQLGALLSTLKAEYRSLEKQWSRELKSAQKQSSKRKRKAGNRAPSGFVKPTRISDELASFLEKPTGTEMARTEVTREINVYIRNHNLQDKANGRKINPDTKLASLLKLKKTDELTYFNLQKYMSPHFAKAVKAEVVATA
jgi:upstream activation factor subunit UAF30